MLLLTATILVLSPVLFADFIRLDDYGHLFENPQLRRGSVSGLVGLWTRSYFNLYIPITYSVWWALALVGDAFGDLAQSAWLFHAFNLVVHLANVVLVFGLVRTLVNAAGRASPTDADRAIDGQIALLGTLVFAIHPVQVETVAWVSELKGELAALLGLLGLRLHLRSRRRALVVGLFVAAMLAKPSAIIFPGVVFAIDRIILRKNLRACASAAALYGAPLLVLAVVTKHLQPDSEMEFIPAPAQRLVVAADAIAFYVTKVLAPFRLAVDYGRAPQRVLHETSPLRLTASGLVAVGGIALTVKAFVRPGSPERVGPGRSLISCGWAIFLISILPVLGLVSFGFQKLSTVADHYLYVPLFGVAVLVAGVLVSLRDAKSSRQLAAVPLLALAALTFQQARRWRSTETLFSHTMAVNPRSYLGAFTLGDELMRAGRLDEGIGWLERSFDLNPDNLNAVLTLGMAFVQKGEVDRAVDLYRSALAKNPSADGTRAKNVAAVHNNLGMLLLRSGDREAGVAQFRQAVAIFPRSLNAHLNLGNIALGEGRNGDAVAEFETALALSPGNRGIEQRLASARLRAQQP